MSLTFNPNSRSTASERNRQQSAGNSQSTRTSTNRLTVDTQSETSLSNTSASGSNPLHKFQTYNCLFTLAALSRAQHNSGKFSTASTENIICSSKGDWQNSGRRVSTSFGQFDYFIDDLMIVSQPAFSPGTGNMFATKITFKVTEPYSMGLFILACKEGAKAAGYEMNFQTAPYLLIIEFAGNVNGQPQLEPQSTRYIPIMFTKVEFKVTGSGTVYDCEAVPYNEAANRDYESRTLTDIILRGKDVKSLITASSGSTGGASITGFGSNAYEDKSLEAAIRRQYREAVNDNSFSVTDDISIIFPKDWTSTTNDGNEISAAVVFKDYNDSGTVPFPDYDKVFNEARNIIRNTQVNITPDKNFHFPQGIKIQDIIQEIIIRSDYITNQIEGDQIKADARGFVNWFRIEVHIQDKTDSPEYNRQSRLYIYRVIPYKVHMSNFLPPSRQPDGLDNLRNSVSRIYQYIYTGKNSDIIDLNLDFNMSTWVVATPADVAKRTGTNNANQGGLQAGGSEMSEDPTSVVPSQLVSSGLPDDRLLAPAQAPSPSTVIKINGGAGNDSEKTAQARFLVDRIANIASLLTLDLTIHGDPYYIPSSGMGNQIVPPVNENLLSDGSMNYQDSEVDVLVQFRTPIDLDPQSGLYKFDKQIDLYSGLYRVFRIESKFVKNNFTQTLQLFKRLGEYGTTKATAPITEQVGATRWTPTANFGGPK
jgi:hypothetical protein